jgi:hypothetical protein
LVVGATFLVAFLPKVAHYCGVGTIMLSSHSGFTPSRTFIKLVGLCTLFAQSALSQTDILRYDNGPFVNRPGQGPYGLDGSVLQSGMGVYSWPASEPDNVRVADDFIIPNGQTWSISRISFFLSQSLALTDAVFTSLSLRIWNGVPSAPSSSVIWGDNLRNVLTDCTFSGAYRYNEGNPNPYQPIFQLDANVGATLEPGTYWLDWAATGAPLVSGPSAYQIPITIDGQTTTGNGLWTPSIATWGPATDVGPQGFPFQIYTVPEPSVMNLAALGLVAWFTMSSKRALAKRRCVSNNGAAKS